MHPCVRSLIIPSHIYKTFVTCTFSSSWKSNLSLDLIFFMIKWYKFILYGITLFTSEQKRTKIFRDDKSPNFSLDSHHFLFEKYLQLIECRYVKKICNFILCTGQDHGILSTSQRSPHLILISALWLANAAIWLQKSYRPGDDVIRFQAIANAVASKGTYWLIDWVLFLRSNNTI